jgi:hypothetical protein
MFTTPYTPIQGMHVSGEKIAYLMRKHDDGFEPIGGMTITSTWAEEVGEVQDDMYPALGADHDGNINYAWFTRKEAAIMEIRGQPFF